MPAQITCPNCQHQWEYKSKYPFADMEVGDSEFYAGITRRDSAPQCAYQYGKKAGKRFKATTVDGGVLIERVE
jgi:hypothetical protein